MQFCIGRSEFYYSNSALSSCLRGEIVNISRNLKRLMENKGVSAYRLAKDMNVSQTSIKNWLDGGNPHEFMLDKISSYFGCSVSALEDKGNMRGKTGN